ncbi:MAG: YggS family pyridoxal phosphate-dependent enzyme [Alphaproteobacteria bacterium]|nr:YggS family pyridoxal phosphate-dependent enzyme [Alphaproteobacteria bacterium]
MSQPSPAVASLDLPPLDPAAAWVACRHRIVRAARKSGRDPATVHLTAVSKTQPWSAIAPVLAAGQIVFGENRVQEAQARWGERRQGLELRLIGPLQSNKAREAVALFDVIETLDRPRLAAALVQAMEKLGVTPRLYVQVNTGEEPQKAGVIPSELPAFLALCRSTYGLTLEGLMCIPPADAPPGPHFALLAKLARRHGLDRLSMGMSGDYEIAIRHGATDVRIGSALFGARPPTPVAAG